jgi:class 3 adenylate cyclase/YHS domain-containing protein
MSPEELIGRASPAPTGPNADDPSEVSTFAFVDLAGFTALTEAHGDRHAADLAADFAARIGEIAGEHGGQPVKAMGDAVLLRDPSAASAVGTALAIDEREGRRTGVPSIRIGMHTGGAVERSGDWFGSAVNLAARVAAVAAGGEIVLTAATRDAVGPLETADYQALGARSFKNVREPVRLFRVVPRGTVGGRLDIDPVCHMVLGEDREIGSLTYHGRRFRFCSLECARQFASDPELFVDDR